VTKAARGLAAPLPGGASSGLAPLADEGAPPSAHMHAAAEYRRHVSRLLTPRALNKAGG
jgi:carbon-monoxide dehydrogenase medium subunit